MKFQEYICHHIVIYLMTVVEVLRLFVKRQISRRTRVCYYKKNSAISIEYPHSNLPCARNNLMAPQNSAVLAYTQYDG